MRESMIRKMRRNRQQMTQAQTQAVLARGTSGVLSVHGDDGYPYGVPLSYVYETGRIYFHSANVGHKIDGIRNNDKVSFCVIDQDQIVPEKFTTLFRSVIVFGKARIVTDPKEWEHAIFTLAKRYSPKESQTHMEEEVESSRGNLCLIALDIEEMTGKQSLQLMGE